MHWADKLADQIIKSGKYLPYWVDDMKTPSGRVHIGSVRAFLTHAFIYQALKDRQVEVNFSYVLEDHDPFNKIPSYIDASEYSQHLGKPLYRIPSPEPGFKSYGQRWAQEYIDIFHELGVKVQIIWGSELYLSGKMNGVVIECLNSADKIRKIYKKLYKQRKPKDWYPINVICENCGKLSTTYATAWDGKEVEYECRLDQVKWTQGCGHQGKVSPLNGNAKMPWKVEWPCKWKVIGVTIEGAGKDHMTEGGSHDFAKLMCKEVIDYPVPFHFSHEFFLTGGSKMSSSKGIGSSAREIANIIPAYLIKFAVARVKYNKAIDFDPYGMSIPDLFDAYDEAALAYWEKSNDLLSRVYELSQVAKIDEQKKFLPRFRDVVQFLQDPKIDLKKKFSEIKGDKLDKDEQRILDERTKYAKIWLKDYAPDEFVFQIDDQVGEQTMSLSDLQIKYLREVDELIKQPISGPEELQQQLYDLSRKVGLSPKKAFQALYTSLIGKTFGPKAAWLIYDQQKTVRAKLKQVLEKLTTKGSQSESSGQIKMRSDYVFISPQLARKYPSVSIGYAVIKGVSIAKPSPDLEKEKAHLLATYADLTTKQLGEYPEIKSYRQLYKEMGVRWQSRRPSPEALLRRIALNKGLYTVNTCVDAYNLVVMKYRVSVGAFDLDKFKFPCELKIAKGGEKILLLGDEEETELKAGEISYFDQTGPYNLDFNYRDAQRTMVTDKTKNVFINIDGIYDVTPDKVQKSLNETLEMIQKYCGGEIIARGVITV